MQSVRAKQGGASRTPSICGEIRAAQDGLCVLGSAGCQPAVAGSLPATVWGAHIPSERQLNAMHLGKLPRCAGWQPALPKIGRHAHRPAKLELVIPALFPPVDLQ